MDLCLNAVIGHSTPPVWSRMCSYGLGPFCCYGSGSTPYHFKAPVGKEFLEEKRRSMEELEVRQDYERSNRIIKSTRKREHDPQSLCEVPIQICHPPHALLRGISPLELWVGAGASSLAPGASYFQMLLFVLVMLDTLR